MPKWSLTSPQRMLLNELDLNLGDLFGQAARNLVQTKKNINKKASKVDSSGGLETPPKDLRHREFMMGKQSKNSHGTIANKVGRPDSGDVGENSVHAIPTSMEDPTGLINLGEPLDRGLSYNLTGDDANAHPNSKHSPKLDRLGEKSNEGKDWSSFGNRYPGARNT